MFEFKKAPGVKYKFPYWKIAQDLNALAEKGDHEANEEAKLILREMGKADLFFFLYFILGLSFLNNSFHVPRVYEVQKENTGTVDLWAREHGKSTIITKGLTLWEIINDPETTIGILSYDRNLAKSFLRGIKTEIELNQLLKATFSEVFYQNPQKEAVKWSEDDGIIVKRKQVVPEATVEAWGLVDGMPTGKHFKTLVYDDIVTDKTVNTPEQIEKTKAAFRMSTNIGRRGGKQRVIGTIYHYSDLYSELRKMNIDWKIREFPAEIDGEPLYLTKKELQEKRRKMGVYVYSSQMLMQPVADDAKKFQLEWIKYYQNAPTLNYYIVVDPAGSKMNRSDYTVMWVFGVDSFKNCFIVDCVRDRLNLGERWKKLKWLVERWRPMSVGYEKYGMMGDVDYIKEKMGDEGFFFTLVVLAGFQSKQQRIEALIPFYEEGKIFMPKYIPYRTLEGKVVDITQVFISEEYLTYPYCEHDDMLDCLARMKDEKLGIVYPFTARPEIKKQKPFDPFRTEAAQTGWMGL